MREEFQRLEELLSMEGELKPEKAKEILAEASQLFEKLKDVVFNGTPEEKNDIIRLMTKLNVLVKKQFHNALKSSGLSEEQFMQIAENPQNFTPDQWERMQETKNSLSAKSKELSKVVAKAEHFIKDQQLINKPHSIGSESEPSDKGPGLRPKRKNWIKS